MQTLHDDVVSEKDDALMRLQDVQRSADTHRHDKADILLRAEIDRLRLEL